jgi:hypothetical protein
MQADSISEHSDKTLDIAHGTPIVSISFGASRVFTLKSKSKLKAGTGPEEVQKITLPNNSALLLDLETNAAYTHRIGKDNRPDGQRRQDEIAYGGQRISITLRCIATHLRTSDGRLFGQGAVHKTEAELNAALQVAPADMLNGSYGTSKATDQVSPAEETEATRLHKAFATENKQAAGFDWVQAYGKGFDILGHETYIP